ncbi:MAG: glycosyltransferase family 39 protein [Bacteroidia bacterium]
MRLRLGLQKYMTLSDKKVFGVSSPGFLLILATLVKILVIYFFYQKVVGYDGNVATIQTGYGWSGLVESMQRGEYELNSQSGLSDLYDLNAKALRTPLYALFLYALTFLGPFASWIAVIVQSIVTSLVAWFGYKIIRRFTTNDRLPLIGVAGLFIFPMNFLKSGTIDDAPMMLMFSLISAYYLILYFQQGQRHLRFLIWGAAFMGFAILTRTILMPVFMALCLYMLIFTRKRWLNTAVFITMFYLVLSPWIIRNYAIYDQIVIIDGTNRFFVITQSDEFIERFPETSIDDIERSYLREYHETHPYLSDLDALELNREFGRLAVEEFKEDPWNMVEATFVKLKVFLPYKIFPERENNTIKSIVYVIPYLISLLLFLYALVWKRHFNHQLNIMLVFVVCYAAVGVVFLLLSRHFYPLIVYMALYGLMVLGADETRKKSLTAVNQAI